MDLEKELAEYRAKKEKRQARITEVQQNAKKLYATYFSKPMEMPPHFSDIYEDKPLIRSPPRGPSPLQKELFEKHKFPDKFEPMSSSSSTCSSDDFDIAAKEDSGSFYFNVVYYLLWCIIWGGLYYIFIQMQFGTVYLIVTALIFMYVNTRTTPKKAGEVSAYSVFNKNCESIDGTLKAEQFEREIRYGAQTVR